MLIDTIPRKQTGPSNFIQNTEGLLMLYDNNRSKWLSISREIITFGIDHNNLQSNHWMMIHNQIRSNIEGYYIYRNSTITSICVKTKNESIGKFKIINNSNCIYNIELNNESNKIVNNLNIDLNITNSIRVLLDVIEGIIDYPIIILEIAWRN
jgi:hypothetical protein